MCYPVWMAAKQQASPARKVIVNARIDPADVAELDRLGREAKPVPASRSEMIAVAVRDYVQRNGRKSK